VPGLPLPRIVLPGSASHVTGSYAPTANVVLRTAPDFSTVSSSCAGAGLGFLKIVPANPPGAISQGTW
jgi:hypothetical protein